MKIKSLISVVTLSIFAILAGGYSATSLFVIAVVVIVFVLFAGIQGFQDEKLKKFENEDEEHRKEAYLLKRAKEEAYQKARSEFVTQNGEPDKTIIIEDTDLNSEIWVYESAKKVYIMGNEYLFKDIMSCTFTDSPRTVKGKIIAETKSKNGNVIGRAIVGSIVAGSAGAIIGGTTGKKNTVYHQEDDKVVHDYTVVINMNSIITPILRIHTGERGRLTNEIVGLMNVIITRK